MYGLHTHNDAVDRVLTCPSARQRRCSFKDGSSFVDVAEELIPKLYTYIHTYLVATHAGLVRMSHGNSAC